MGSDKPGKNGKVKIIVVAAVIILVYFTGVLYNQQKIIDSKSSQLAEIESKIAAEKSINEDLLKAKANMLTEEYVRRVAREKLGMICPGERIYIDTNR